MKLTPAQLKKLTPAQRKAREKRLAYNRRYDALQRAKKDVKKMTPALKSAIKDFRAREVKPIKKIMSTAKTLSSIDRLETLVRELRDCRAKQESIIAEIQSIKL